MIASGKPDIAPAELFEAAVAAADQGARVARVDDVKPMLLDVENDQEERDVQVEHAAIFKLMVELLDDPRRRGVAAQEHFDLGRQLGGQQGGGHSLAHDVADGDRPPGGDGSTAGRFRRDGNDAVIIAADVAGRLVVGPKIVTRHRGRAARARATASPGGQTEARVPSRAA